MFSFGGSQGIKLYINGRFSARGMTSLKLIKRRVIDSRLRSQYYRAHIEHTREVTPQQRELLSQLMPSISCKLKTIESVAIDVYEKSRAEVVGMVDPVTARVDVLQASPLGILQFAVIVDITIPRVIDAWNVPSTENSCPKAS
ncbi:MAG: hypothetical protein WC107_00715 [Patescibacteria group bacterium]